ncbi:putative membrane protein YeiH [Breoghania corrubedonensis]|uniref:Putative membrane protein YeiH n=1 Tax=Breoghania corrubedonensis TaxID=665038 RepID=A0A2T5VG65_9HYPH|nr:trimeric intracellular cation channel family protein [Breoghania corrubedonensis]PTW62749.1 putative membrane protein YeiH [Breoghania corrubedonensis]
MANLLQILDFIGVAVFAISGGIVASRLKLDILAFVLLATFTGIGGGTLRDLLLGAPVFWVGDQTYLLICIAAGIATWYLAHLGEALGKPLRWADAVGMASYSVMGAAKTLTIIDRPVVAVLMGVATAAFGGVIRDTIASQPSAIINREIYLTAAFGGAFSYVMMVEATMPPWPAAIVSGVIAFGLRAGAIQFGWSLPGYRPPGNE